MVKYAALLGVVFMYIIKYIFLNNIQLTTTSGALYGHSMYMKTFSSF